MHITARLEQDTVRQLLDELLPVTIVLDDDWEYRGSGDQY